MKIFDNTKKVITWPFENESRNIDEVTAVYSISIYQQFDSLLISAFTIALLSASEDDISLSTKRRGQRNSLSSPQSVTFDRKFNHREKKSTYITSKVCALQCGKTKISLLLKNFCESNVKKSLTIGQFHCYVLTIF